MGKRLMQLYDDEARSLRAGFVPRFSVHERFAAEFGDNPKETLSKIIDADEENKNRFRLRSLK
jgi:hypothetical protein